MTKENLDPVPVAVVRDLFVVIDHPLVGPDPIIEDDPLLTIYSGNLDVRGVERFYEGSRIELGDRAVLPAAPDGLAGAAFLQPGEELRALLARVDAVGARWTAHSSLPIYS